MSGLSQYDKIIRNRVSVTIIFYYYSYNNIPKLFTITGHMLDLSRHQSNAFWHADGLLFIKSNRKIVLKVFDDYSASAILLDRYTQRHTEPIKQGKDKVRIHNHMSLKRTWPHGRHSSQLQEFHIAMSKMTSSWYIADHKNIKSCSEVCV